jgi:hypothetical protein
VALLTHHKTEKVTGAPRAVYLSAEALAFFR